jgi:hypothetical protein
MYAVQALRVPGGSGSRISRHSALEGIKPFGAGIFFKILAHPVYKM